MIGQNAQQFSGIVKRIYDEWDMIGNHTWDHRALRGLSSWDIINEIQKTQDIIYKITWYTPILFRPPYGAQNKMILRISHLASVQRSLDSNDRKLPSSEILVKHIMDRVHPWSIILMHDTLTWTVQALPQIIDSLEKSGYTLVTVGKLLWGYKYIHPWRIYRRQRTISHIMQ
jgi:peptidoglycan/xylan/chitin deacetylase (PgdA/CDA1 family)